MPFARTLAFIVPALALSAGCASVSQTYGPDGRKTYTLDCSGTSRDWDRCLSAADDICKAAGYDVLDRKEENTGRLIDEQKGIYGIKPPQRSMVIACKG